MKRILLFLTCILTLFGIARAETWTKTFEFKDYSLSGDVTDVILQVSPEIKAVFAKGKGTLVTQYNSGIRFHIGNTLEISTPEGYVLDKIEIPIPSSSYKFVDPSVNKGTINNTDNKFTWTKNDDSEDYTSVVIGAGTKQVRFVQISITYSSKDIDNKEELPTFEYSSTTAQWDLAAGASNENLPTLKMNPSDLEVTYTSSETSVARVNSDGSVTPKGEGTTIITAQFAGNDTYKAKSASYTLTVKDSTPRVEPVKKSVTFDFTKETYGLPNDQNTYVANPTTITSEVVNITLNCNDKDGWRLWSDGLRAMNTKSPTFTVSVLNAKITKVSFTGLSGCTFKVDGYKNGTNVTEWTGSENEVTFIYTASKNVAVTDITVEYEIEDNGKPYPTLSFDPKELSVIYGHSFTEPTLNVEVDGNIEVKVTYSSSDENIAKVDSETGKLELIGNFGSTTITAYASETESYNEGSASYTLTVIDPNRPTYVLVSNLDQINEADTYIFVYNPASGTPFAMGAKNGDYYSNVQIDLENNLATGGNGEVLLGIEKISEGYYAFRLPEGTYLDSTKEKTMITTSSKQDGKASVVMDEQTKRVKINFGSATKGSELFFQYNASSPRFTTYQSGSMNDVQIYRKVTLINLGWYQNETSIADEINNDTHEGTHRVKNVYELRSENDEANQYLSLKVTCMNTHDELMALDSDNLDPHYSLDNLTVTFNKAGNYTIEPTFETTGHNFYAETTPLAVTINPLTLEVTSEDVSKAWSNNGSSLSFAFTEEDSAKAAALEDSDFDVTVTPGFDTVEMPKTGRPEGFNEDAWDDMLEIMAEDYNVDGYYYSNFKKSASLRDDNEVNVEVQFPCSGTYTVELTSTDPDVVFTNSSVSATIYPTTNNTFNTLESGVINTFSINSMFASDGEIKYYKDPKTGELWDQANLATAYFYTPGLYLYDAIYYKVPQEAAVALSDTEAPAGYEEAIGNTMNLSSMVDYADGQTSGEYTLSIIVKKNGVLTPAGENTYAINFTTTVPTGVDAIAPAEGEGEAEYFTLQGVRVQNPDKGIFIVKKGGKTAKVVL